MTPAIPHSRSAWSFPPGARLLALDDLDCLLLEKSDAPAPRSDAAKVLNTLASVASNESVFLLNDANRVEGLVDLNRPMRMQIENFSGIRPVMMAPGLSHRLGRWKRERRYAKGFWSVVFEDAEAADDDLRAMLEKQILTPWINEEKRIVIELFGHTHARYADARLHRSLAKYNKELDRAVRVLWADHIRPSARLSSILPDNCVVIDAGVARQIANSVSQLTEVQDEVARTLEHEPELQEPGSAKASDVVSKMEIATQAVDQLSQSLSSVASQVAATEAVVGASSSSTAEPDPIHNAIEIRERLTRSVTLLDAAKWAKWRGASSKNPSAALGKYKTAGRLFAVRNGNRDLYPAFQFSENGEPLPIIEEILQAVPREAQGWSLLSWFEAKNALLRGRKPSEVLSREPQAVLEAVGRFYSRED